MRGSVGIEQRNQDGLPTLLEYIERCALSAFGGSSASLASIRFLKSSGADFQAKTPDGRTALHIWSHYYLRLLDSATIEKNWELYVEFLGFLIDCGVPVDAVDSAGTTAVERSCAGTIFDFMNACRIDRTLQCRLWREVLENTGNDPAQFQVLVNAFPDLQRNVDTQASHTEDIASDQSSEASLDHDPAVQARTSEPPSPSPFARVRAPAGTFWDVIDYAVEQQEGNPWES